MRSRSEEAYDSSVDPATGKIVWNYTLRWTITDSMALQTTREFHIPESILERASVLQHAFDDICRGSVGIAIDEDYREEEHNKNDDPLRSAEENFYQNGMEVQSIGSSDRHATHIELSELGGTVGEAYERQGLEKLLAMTMQLQEKEEGVFQSKRDVSDLEHESIRITSGTVAETDAELHQDDTDCGSFILSQTSYQL